MKFTAADQQRLRALRGLHVREALLAFAENLNQQAAQLELLRRRVVVLERAHKARFAMPPRNPIAEAVKAEPPAPPGVVSELEDEIESLTAQLKAARAAVVPPQNHGRPRSKAALEQERRR